MSPRLATRLLPSGRGLLTWLLILVFLESLTAVPWRFDLIRTGGLTAVGQFFSAALRPELSPRFLEIALKAAGQTVAYAATGMSLAVLVGAVLGLIGSGVLVGSPSRRLLAALPARGLLGFFRAIHELVWAWLFVVALGLSPVAGVLALGIPYGGILGRIFADQLVDVPLAPLRSLESAGASRWQVLFYGRLPRVLPDMIRYLLYRTECAIRASAVFSFIGLGGLGYQIQLSLDELLYGQVWTLLAVLVFLIVMVDAWSSEVRRRLAG